MYRWWVRLSSQATRSEVNSTYEHILRWGAKTVDTGSLTDMDYAFTSDKNPTRFLHKLTADNVVINWGFLSKSKLAKPKRNPTYTPSDKPKAFEELKKRFGTTLGGKS